MTTAERSRIYRELNREAVRARDRARERDPERHRRYRAANREAVNARERARSTKRQAEGRRPARREDAEHKLARHNRRRARRAAVFVEPVNRDAVLIRDCGICGICGEPVGPDWHLDHVVPLAKGGEHSYANVQASHPRCNMSKGAR